MRRALTNISLLSPLKMSQSPFSEYISFSVSCYKLKHLVMFTVDIINGVSRKFEMFQQKKPL